MISLLITLTVLAVCRATPFYVPESACANMLPGILDTGEGYMGHVAQPQEGPHPYTFTYTYDEEEFAYRGRPMYVDKVHTPIS